MFHRTFRAVARKGSLFILKPINNLVKAQWKADRVPGRLVVRRIPDFNAEKNKTAGQDALFGVWRFHAFFATADATVLDTVAADKTHLGTRSSSRSTLTSHAYPGRPE